MIGKKILNAIVFVSALTASSFAMSQTIVSTSQVDEIGTINIVNVGVQSIAGAVAPFTENLVFFTREGGWQAGCSFNVMYFDPSTTLGKNWYATLLTAKAAGLPLGRVLYRVDTLDTGSIVCTVTDGGILQVQ